jgi:hypothetical protein
MPMEEQIDSANGRLAVPLKIFTIVSVQNKNPPRNGGKAEQNLTAH